MLPFGDTARNVEQGCDVTGGIARSGEVMPIVFKAIMPHGDELLPFTPADSGLEILRSSMWAIGQSLRACEPDLVLIATGSELQLVAGAYRVLSGEGRRVRVVSMPSIELFKAQPKEYRDAVLPPGCRRRLAVEAAVAQPWWEFVGLDGGVVAMESFGASAPAEALFEKFGFTVDRVAERARTLLGR